MLVTVFYEWHLRQAQVFIRNTAYIYIYVHPYLMFGIFYLLNTLIFHAWFGAELVTHAATWVGGIDN